MAVRSQHPNERHWADTVVLAGTLCVIALLALFPVRNNDVWWHMAVGRQILETRSFITTDPFSFTLGGTPWVPQSYLAGILFYLCYTAGSAPALIVLRALLVLALFLLMIRMIARAGFPLSLVAPLLLLAALTVNSRFIIRPHLFEYLFLAIMLGWLLAPHKRRGAAWYLVPAFVQIAWVNTHPSFFLGPLLALVFFAGEGVAKLLGRRAPFLGSPAAQSFEWKPAVMLVVVLLAACVVNPAPLKFLAQPLNGEQRELLTSYTLEWRSPFDPMLRGAPFHPWFELLLACAGACFLLGARRLHLSSLLLTGICAALALSAHRFRFEFAVVAVPLMILQLGDSRAGALLAGTLGGTGGRTVAVRVTVAVVLCGMLLGTARPPFVIGGGTADRYPRQAFEFLRGEHVGQRPFHPIGFGSFLIWYLYPERRTFIDGRNYSASLYRDFLDCQTDPAGFNRITNAYDLDAFIIPAPDRADPGMTNVHRFLVDSPLWRLVYIDRIASIFVRSESVAAAWLADNAFELYDPFSFGPASVTGGNAGRFIAELERAARIDPRYYRPQADLGAALLRIDRPGDALRAFERAAGLEPGKRSVWHNFGVAAARAGQWEQAATAFERETVLAPERLDAHIALAKAYLRLGNLAAAERTLNRARRIDPDNRDVRAVAAELDRARSGG